MKAREEVLSILRKRHNRGGVSIAVLATRTQRSQKQILQVVTQLVKDRLIRMKHEVENESLTTVYMSNTFSPATHKHYV